jgi:hypothetical protein
MTDPQPGWVTAPVEPTREMWAAMADAVLATRDLHHDAITAAVWSAALAAAPQQPAPPGREVAVAEAQRLLRRYSTSEAGWRECVKGLLAAMGEPHERPLDPEDAEDAEAFRV